MQRFECELPAEVLRLISFADLLFSLPFHFVCLKYPVVQFAFRIPEHSALFRCLCSALHALLKISTNAKHTRELLAREFREWKFIRVFVCLFHCPSLLLNKSIANNEFSVGPRAAGPEKVSLPTVLFRPSPIAFAIRDLSASRAKLNVHFHL